MTAPAGPARSLIDAFKFLSASSEPSSTLPEKLPLRVPTMRMGFSGSRGSPQSRSVSDTSELEFHTCTPAGRLVLGCTAPVTGDVNRTEYNPHASQRK